MFVPKHKAYEERAVGDLCQIHGVAISTYESKISKAEVLERLRTQPEFVFGFESVVAGAVAMLARFDGQVPQPEHVGAASEVQVRVKREMAFVLVEHFATHFKCEVSEIPSAKVIEMPFLRPPVKTKPGVKKSPCAGVLLELTQIHPKLIHEVVEIVHVSKRYRTQELLGPDTILRKGQGVERFKASCSAMVDKLVKVGAKNMAVPGSAVTYKAMKHLADSVDASKSIANVGVEKSGSATGDVKRVTAASLGGGRDFEEDEEDDEVAAKAGKKKRSGGGGGSSAAVKGRSSRWVALGGRGSSRASADKAMVDDLVFSALSSASAVGASTPVASAGGSGGGGGGGRRSPSGSPPCSNRAVKSIEFDEDDDCVFSIPKILRGALVGRSLRAVSLIIIVSNQM